MKIIESSIIGKKSQDLCEDGLVITNSFVAVIDGSTSKTDKRINGVTFGKMAMLIISDAIRSFRENISAFEAVESLTSRIHLYYENNGLLGNAKLKGQNRLTCSVVIYSRFYDEVWMIGDCQFRYANRTVTNEKLVDSILSQIRADALNYKLNTGSRIHDLQSFDVGRAIIFDALKDQCSFQNSDNAGPFSYAVVDGFKIDFDKVKNIKLHSKQYDTLVLASDGYPVLRNTLKETEESLFTILEKDPLLINDFKATKGWIVGNNSFDDRTFVLIQL